MADGTTLLVSSANLTQSGLYQTVWRPACSSWVVPRRNEPWNTSCTCNNLGRFGSSGRKRSLARFR